jgi:uroporphyrin-3 C-methyltransferase
VYDEVRDLVRVSRIEQPEAVLLSPEQTFFLRENLKLKLLNARIGLLARQPEAARADLASAAAVINKYFDPAGRKTQVAAGLLQQVQSQVKAVELPRLDETMGALATAGAGTLTSCALPCGFLFCLVWRWRLPCLRATTRGRSRCSGHRTG